MISGIRRHEKGKLHVCASVSGFMAAFPYSNGEDAGQCNLPYLLKRYLTTIGYLCLEWRGTAVLAFEGEE